MMAAMHWGDTDCGERQSFDDSSCDPRLITCVPCRSLHDKALENIGVVTFAPWTDRPRTERADHLPHGAVQHDNDFEFQVLAKCVHELNKLNAVDKAAASRVTDYLFNRYTGK